MFTFHTYLNYIIDWKYVVHSHQLVSVEVNHNYGMTLYAPSRDEKARVHKKQGHGTTYGG
jgi:hypothetical protein